jgi:acetyl-CoA carboxylase alpha subunit
MSTTITTAIRRHLKQLGRLKPDTLRVRRYKKYRAMGKVTDR